MIGYLGETGSKKDTFVEFAHLLQELVHVRPLEHVHLVHSQIYLNGHHEVRIVYRLKITHVVTIKMDYLKNNLIGSRYLYS